jgi:hypothetical protein
MRRGPDRRIRCRSSGPAVDVLRRAIVHLRVTEDDGRLDVEKRKEIEQLLQIVDQFDRRPRPKLSVASPSRYRSSAAKSPRC